MAGASDKARFYLEQTVPELREWERREIFSKDEISAIAAKRSDFEHILCARGSTPADYVRYTEYEMNLDALRRKRVKRKGVRVTAHSGQRRLFTILDRATRKFPGDIELWMQAVDYARKQKANKKLKRLLTDVLRMHPTRAELWIYAARYAMDVQADVGNARSYMQRGLRFCKNSRSMYLEYARLEMDHVAKIHTRRKILGLDGKENGRREEARSAENNSLMEQDLIEFPDFTADNDLNPSTQPGLEPTPTDDVALTPAMTGAIPAAIMEAAMKQFDHSEAVAESFFDLFYNYSAVPHTRGLLESVVELLTARYSDSAATISCRCRMYIFGIAHDSVAFPQAVGGMVKDIRASLRSVDPSLRRVLCEKLSLWLAPLAKSDGLVPEIKQVLLMTDRQLTT